MVEVRQRTSPRRLLTAALAATGTVVMGAGAHASAGAPLPAPDLLLLLGALLTGLAWAAPAKLRSFKVRLAVASLLQPALHLLFEALPSGNPTGRHVVAMLAAHGVAAVVGTWWFARGVRLVTSVAILLARRLLVRRHPRVLVRPLQVGTTERRTARRTLSSWHAPAGLRGPPLMPAPR